MVAQADADQVDDRVLHRDLDLLAFARGVSLHQRGENADHAVHARARVADRRPDEGRRAVGEARDAHGAAHRLGYRLVALVVAVRTIRPEALDARVDEARVEGPHGLHSRSPGDRGHRDRSSRGGHRRSSGARRKTFFARGFFRFSGRLRLLALNERKKRLSESGRSRMGLPRDVAALRLFDLDDVRPEPCEHLAARGPGLIVREVDHPDARKGLRHALLIASLKDTSRSSRHRVQAFHRRP